MMAHALHISLGLIAAYRVYHGCDQRLSGAALGKGRANLLLSAKGALYHAAVLGVERHAQCLQIRDNTRRLLHHTPYGVGIGEVASATNGVGKVVARRVVLPHEIEGRVDAPFGHNRLRALRRQGRDEHARHAGAR